MSPPGLCAACAWSRTIATKRGATFVLCSRAEQDPAFPKYPALPVVACPGYEPQGGVSS